MEVIFGQSALQYNAFFQDRPGCEPFNACTGEVTARCRRPNKCHGSPRRARPSAFSSFGNLMGG